MVALVERMRVRMPPMRVASPVPEIPPVPGLSPMPELSLVPELALVPEVPPVPEVLLLVVLAPSSPHRSERATAPLDLVQWLDRSPRPRTRPRPSIGS